MLSVEKGIVLDQITITRPSPGITEKIIKAQSRHPNRRIQVEWPNKEGQPLVMMTINPTMPRTAREINKLATLVAGARLTIQQILPLKI